MDLYGEALYYGLGLAFWTWSYFRPFRRLAGRPDYKWDLIGALAVAVFAVAAGFVLGWASDFVEAVPWLEGWVDTVDRLPFWCVVIAYIIAADFGAYWAHRLLHSRLLWPAHAWHHSPTVLYWLSGLRGSPIHILVLFSPYVLAALLFPTPDIGLVALAVTVLDTANQHLIHSNIRLPWQKHLEWLLVTPRFHFVHHSTTVARSNSNYGFIFSIWDRMFGTLTDPDAVPADDPLGLDYPFAKWRLLLGIDRR